MTIIQQRKPGKPSFWRRRFLQRFVQTTEAFGYLLCLAVAIGLIYSVIVKVEVLADVEGTLQPRAVPVVAQTETAIAEFLTQPGETVAPDQPLCKIAADAAARRSVYVGRMLDRASKALAGDADARNQQALPNIIAAASMFHNADAHPVLSSPSAGLAVPQQELLDEETIPPNTPLVIVYDPRQAQFEGIVKDIQKAPVKTGQTVRWTLPGKSGVVSGAIERIDELEGGGVNVIAIFHDLSESPQTHLRAWVQENATTPAPTPISAQIQVVTGTQSLFKSLFGRK